jgi:hypothetical protein
MIVCHLGPIKPGGRCIIKGIIPPLPPMGGIPIREGMGCTPGGGTGAPTGGSRGWNWLGGGTCRGVSSSTRYCGSLALISSIDTSSSGWISRQLGPTGVTFVTGSLFSGTTLAVGVGYTGLVEGAGWKIRWKKYNSYTTMPTHLTRNAKQIPEKNKNYNSYMSTSTILEYKANINY